MKMLNVERHHEIGGLALLVRRVGLPALGRRGLCAAVATVSALVVVGCVEEEGLPADVLVDSVTMHRLNGAEYDNTVRDLLGTSLRPSADFPADDFGAMFDNQADVLSIAPLHLEAWEMAADAVLADVLSMSVAEDLWHIEAESPEAVGTTGAQSEDGWNLYANGSITAFVDLPMGGTYRIESRLHGQQGGPDVARAAFVIDGVEVYAFDVPETAEAPGTYSATFDLQAGSRSIGVAFLNDFWDPDNGIDRNLVIDWFSLAGPLGATSEPHPGRARLVPCEPAIDGEDACASMAVEAFLPRAWRRPVTVEEVASILALYDLSRSSGGDWEEGLTLALKAALLSPHFVFRVEIDPEPASETAHPLSAWELASRLSYFLWSSMPDDALFGAAADGSLLEDAVLAAQVRRMVVDERAEGLVENLAGQWLMIAALEDSSPDQDTFPTFDDSLRVSMQEQMRRTARDAILGGGSMLALLTDEESWIDARLATHLGVEPPAGDWEKRALDDGPRRGILGTAGLLTALSYPERTTPVLRGKWVLNAITCEAPPPPPGGVDGIAGDNPEGLSFREQMELHRADPLCASCHSVMDNVGFAMENFDAVGRYRETDELGLPVDPTGSVPGGASFAHIGELADALVTDRRVPQCMTRTIFTYALGRQPQMSDIPYLQGIEQRFIDGGHRFEELAVGIALSAPFRQRRGEQP